jgi:hypothetical protein
MLWIVTLGSIATALSTYLGIPRIAMAAAACGYAFLVLVLVIIAVYSAERPYRQLVAYRLLTVIVAWWPSLIGAVRPEDRPDANFSDEQ